MKWKLKWDLNVKLGMYLIFIFYSSIHLFIQRIRSFILHALNEKDLVQLRSILPDGDYLYGAKLLPEVDFSMYAEIDTAWILRDSKFNFVWPSPEAVFTSGMSDIYGVVFAMRSKASSKFLSPRQFLMDRKKEGATEYLGDILY